MKNTKILQVEGLEKVFPVQGGFFSKKEGLVHAVSGVSFEISMGETLGLVGESGCGKTTIGLCILRIIKATNGKILFRGKNILDLHRRALKALRRRIQVIFQDPFGSLNPQWSIGRIVGEGLRVHGIARGSEYEDRVDNMLKKVRLNPEDKFRHPNEFSGGQRQRIAIARALILEPELIIADEPLSALDVSIQAQIINLLTELQRELNFSYLIISHDLSVVKYVSDRLAVMYLGKIVEIANSNDLYFNPKHPYTLALLSAIPGSDPTTKKDRILLSGSIPSPLNPPSGCRFHTRCSKRIDKCEKEEPQLKEVEPSHYCACHLYH
ncbi:MAG: ABC transporter ATP-binding protein [Deltaproteobacteria bacterium]|nr:ABC transporter ATP-binding protein [Deltaproteobacteria bacterium]